MKRLVGLVGYAQAGKDALATALAAHGYVRVAFADALREALAALDPWIPADPLDPMSSWSGGRYGELLERDGYEGAKRHPEVRRLLQRLGTEAGRQVLGADVWIHAWRVRTVPYRRVVATDVRFRNEVDAIRGAGGRIVRVTRPGVGPVNAHASERLAGTVDADVTIANDGSLEDLAAHAERLARLLEPGQVDRRPA